MPVGREILNWLRAALLFLNIEFPFFGGAYFFLKESPIFVSC